MTRLSFDTSMAIQPREPVSAPAATTQPVAGSPGSFDAMLCRVRAANAPQSEPARTASPETPPATTTSSSAASPQPDQGGDSQESSAGQPPTADASPRSGGATDGSSPSGGTADASSDQTTGTSPATVQNGSSSDASTESQATATQTAAASVDSTPTTSNSTPDTATGEDRAAVADKDRSSARDPGQTGKRDAGAKSTATAGAASPGGKRAGGKSVNMPKKAAIISTTKDSAAATALSAAEATAAVAAAVPASNAPGTATPLPTQGTAAAVAAAVPAIRSDGAAGDAATSPAMSLAGDGTSAAGNVGSDPPANFDRAAGGGAPNRRGSEINTSADDSDALAASIGTTGESAVGADPSHQAANMSPVETALAKAPTLDPPVAVYAPKSDASPGAVKSGAPLRPAQAQDAADAGSTEQAAAGAPSSNAQGQSAAGATGADATGQAAAGTSQADRVRLVERVAAAFGAVGGQGGTVRLRLSPPELGAVKVEVSVRNGVMNAHLETETSAARNLLLDNLPALRDRLAQQQIKVEHFDVDLAGQSSGGMPRGANEQARQQSQAYSAVKQNRSAGQQAVDSASAQPAARTAARGRFDVTI